jgi:hypothetical protein
MGAAAGAGGSDKSDEKKVDTYSDQLKKEQARKSKTKKDKFGYTVKKNAVENFIDNDPRTQAVKNVTDKLNLDRRMKFANKNNINLQGLSTEQILSKDFKSQLDAKGYTRETPTGNNNNGNDNNNQPVILKKNVGGQTVQTTEAKVEEDKAKSEKEYDARQTKKKGRRKNILTSAGGVTKVSEDYSLGKKTLLGQVV